MTTFTDVQNSFKSYLDLIFNGIIKADNIFIATETLSSQLADEYIYFEINDCEAKSLTRQENVITNNEIIGVNIITSYKFNLIVHCIGANTPNHMRYGSRILCGFSTCDYYKNFIEQLGYTGNGLVQDVSKFANARNKLISRLTLPCQQNISEFFNIACLIGEVKGTITAPYIDSEGNQQNREQKYETEYIRGE